MKITLICYRVLRMKMEFAKMDSLKMKVTVMHIQSWEL